MSESTKLSMENLFDKRAPQQMVSEANAFKTVPKGMYRLRAKKYEASESGGRVSVYFQVDILSQEGNRLAGGSFKVSPDIGRSKTGALDTQSKLYGQLVKALYASASPEEQAQVSVGELVQTFMQTPVDAFVALQFKTATKNPVTGWPDWVDANTEEEIVAARQAGHVATNIIRSIQKAQG
jgi:hypothetical protein